MSVAIASSNLSKENFTIATKSSPPNLDAAPNNFGAVLAAVEEKLVSKKSEAPSIATTVAPLASPVLPESEPIEEVWPEQPRVMLNGIGYAFSTLMPLINGQPFGNDPVDPLASYDGPAPTVDSTFNAIRDAYRKLQHIIQGGAASSMDEVRGLLSSLRSNAQQLQRYFEQSGNNETARSLFQSMASYADTVSSLIDQGYHP